MRFHSENGRSRNGIKLSTKVLLDQPLDLFEITVIGSA